MTVSAEQRAALARSVSGLRRIFEADYAALAEGKFGIHHVGRRAGEIEDATALSLSAHDLAARDELVGVVEYLRAEGLGASEAVERMVREAVFTTANRLLAIRVAEAIGVLPPSLFEGSRSEGFVEAVEAFPLLRDADDSSGYWTYLQICGDELAHAVPRLFDRRHPLSALVPSAEALDEAVGILTDPVLAEVWVEPEALGWSYQFFNSQDERREMREASSAPRDSRELAVRNQFFTPGYVVDFLVQNTLGRRLRESGFELELPLLLGDVDEGTPPLDLDDVAVLDPAVGSGHFLLGAYDLLERAWGERGVDPEVAAPRIVASLRGIEIDARAAQVAQAVLNLRARRSAPNAYLEPPAIVTARSLPRDPETRRDVLASQPSIVRDIVDELSTALDKAPDLGSLLKVEDVVSKPLAGRVHAPQLGDDTTRSFESIEGSVLLAAREMAQRSEASPAERLFAADASDALRFVESLTSRYDVILMNPPFGNPVKGTQPYLKQHYPIGWTDLFAAFLERSWGLLKPSGVTGAITSSQYFSTRRMVQLRKELLGLRRPYSVIDLGRGVLQTAAVDVALTVMPQERSEGTVQYLDLSLRDDKEELLRDVAVSSKAIDPQPMLDIEGVPFAFHFPAALLRAFASGMAIEGTIAEICSGNTTFDDFRFARLWWEVDAQGREIGWPPFSKGGEYQPYFSPPHLVIDWRDDGAAIRSRAQATGHMAQVMQSSDHWYRPGLMFPYQTSIGLGARYLNAGCIFSTRSVGVFPYNMEHARPLLGLLNSTLAAEIAAAFGRDRTMSSSAVGRLSFTASDLLRVDEVAGGSVDAATASLMAAESLDETSRVFGADPAPMWSQEAIGQRLDSAIKGAVESQQTIDSAVRTVSDVHSRLLPEIEDRSILIARSYAFALREQSAAASAVMSFLFGAAMGRWDVHMPARESEGLDPLQLLPACPPFMLKAQDGLPATEAPPRYPLVLPPNRILHDDPGHERDVVSAMEEAAAQFVFGGPANELGDALRQLKSRDLRTYLRRSFFPEHVKRYSRSRRKAPIYWYFSVPSQEWGLWAYAPWLSREQLFAISRAAHEKLQRLSALTAQLRRDLETGGGREIRDRLEATEDLIRELEVFYEKSETVAQSGWEPDLNDGIILNAAPLENLFADAKWRKDISTHRKKMEKGDYPWATVQRDYFDRLKS